MWTNIANKFHFGAYSLLLLGVTLCGIGSALIIMSGVGIRAMDLVAITMFEKLSLPFWFCKGVLELMLLTSGWFMGGPVGIGTLWFLGVVGWSIQPIMWCGTSFLGLANYGLGQPAAAAAQI
jgi:uncharacterized membrane protein YczE